MAYQHGQVELAVPGVLADIYLHEMDTGWAQIPCATISTTGLASLGQQELSITLRRRLDDADPVPEGIRGFLGYLGQMAADGHFVVAGDITGYRAPGPLGFGEFCGVVYETLPAHPPEALVGVLITEGELAMASQCGTQRVLRMLGMAARCYPWPVWSDPSRPSTYAADDAAHSLLSKVRKLSLREGVTASVDGDDIRLDIGPGPADVLAAGLSTHPALALLPGPAGLRDAALVWRPGQSEPVAVNPGADAPERLAATFVLFALGDGTDNVRFQEDGFSVVLGPESFAELVAGLRTRRELRFVDQGGGSPQRSLLVRFTQ